MASKLSSSSCARASNKKRNEKQNRERKNCRRRSTNTLAFRCFDSKFGLFRLTRLLFGHFLIEMNFFRDIGVIIGLNSTKLIWEFEHLKIFIFKFVVLTVVFQHYSRKPSNHLVRTS
jgi:hypothetical protein